MHPDMVLAELEQAGEYTAVLTNYILTPAVKGINKVRGQPLMIWGVNRHQGKQATRLIRWINGAL